MVLKHFVLNVQYTEHKLNPCIQGRDVVGKAPSDLILSGDDMIATPEARKFRIMASFLLFWGRLSFIVQPVPMHSMLYVLSQLENVLPVLASLLSVFPSYPASFHPTLYVFFFSWCAIINSVVHMGSELPHSSPYLCPAVSGRSYLPFGLSALLRQHPLQPEKHSKLLPAAQNMAVLHHFRSHTIQLVAVAVVWRTCKQNTDKSADIFASLSLYFLYDGRSLGGSTASLLRCVVVAG